MGDGKTGRPTADVQMHEATLAELSIASLFGKMMHLYSAAVARLEETIERMDAKDADEGRKPAPRYQIYNQLERMTGAMVRLSTEIRQQEKSVVARVRRMGVDERLEVFYEWFGNLSRQKQREALQSLARMYNEGDEAAAS